MKFLSRLKTALTRATESPELPVAAPVVETPAPLPPQPMSPPPPVAAPRAPQIEAERPKPRVSAPVAPPQAAKLPPPARVVEKRSPMELRGSPQVQAEWLMQQIGKNAKALVLSAQKGKWTGVGSADVLARADVSALMFGYKMVCLAYQRHHDPPGVEVMRSLRSAITVPMHRAMQNHEGDRVKIVEEHVKIAAAEVAQALATLKESGAQPFAPFYSGLAPAFGGTSPEELEARFGALSRELLIKLEQAMALQASQVAG